MDKMAEHFRLHWMITILAQHLSKFYVRHKNKFLWICDSMEIFYDITVLI